MTPEMLNTLRAFTDYFEAHGVSPTYRELAQLTGNKSQQRSFAQVDALIDSGHIVRTGSRTRARSLAPASVPDLRAVPTGQLRAELARREAVNG